MSKKKIIIYSFTIFIFTALFLLYIWSMFRSKDTLNTERIQDTIRMAETQAEKNLLYASKDINLVIAKYNLESLSSLEDIVSTLAPGKKDLSGYFIADGEGNTYSLEGEQHSWKFDMGALTHAFANGYCATTLSSLQEPACAMIVPFSSSSFYYLVRAIPVKEYLHMIIADITIPTQYLTLYDEWGNPICQLNADPLDATIVKELTDGAIDYCYDRQTNPYQKSSISAEYGFYATLAQPRGWFIGTVTDNTDDSELFEMYAPNIMILLGLILVLTAIVTLDIVNDHDKKKDYYALNHVNNLTGLTNSMGMQEQFNKFQETHAMNQYHFVYMDIVAFSRINTMFGHTVGDSILKIIADVIKRYQHCGCHVNADHFTFLGKSSDSMLSDFESAVTAAIEAQLSQEYMQVISFKFGVYPITTTKVIFRDVYEGALWALKDAKKIPIQSNVVYDSKLKQHMELQKDIEINMMHALSKDEFVVYIQPQFDMPGEHCSRGETLIRWNSEYMGFLPPDKFIPIFENNGFIIETDFYMLTSALELLQKRLMAGLSPITLAVNQSKITIAFPNYFERLKATVEQFDVPLSYIELEITESTLENSWEIILPLIHNVKRLGFSIAMDDFGSGFSSLNTLRILPIDILKIDKDFLQESDESERSRSIIRNVVNMAKDINIKVVCEGVETKTQLQFLKEIGCDIVQGFYYSKPLPMDEFVTQYCDKK